MNISQSILQICLQGCMGMSSFLYLSKDEQPPDDAAGVAVVSR